MNPWLIAVCAAILLCTCQYEKAAVQRGVLPAKAKKQGITAPRVFLVPYFGPRPQSHTTLT